jgi:hypothetical protein
MTHSPLPPYDLQLSGGRAAARIFGLIVEVPGVTVATNGMDGLGVACRYVGAVLQHADLL